MKATIAGPSPEPPRIDALNPRLAVADTTAEIIATDSTDPLQFSSFFVVKKINVPVAATKMTPRRKDMSSYRSTKP